VHPVTKGVRGRWSYGPTSTKVPGLKRNRDTILGAVRPTELPGRAKGRPPDIVPTMSELIEHPSDHLADGESRRGQSLVEFALVLPMLLVLLLGIADFGRVFATGISLEAAARNAAEAAAQEYVQRQRADAAPLTPADYDAIRTVAHRVSCEEATVLPNQQGAPPLCGMPLSAVCVHDADLGDAADCGEPSGAVPADCTQLLEPWTAANEQTVGTGPFLPYVEVRICYRFTTLMNLADLGMPLGWSLTIGDIWLQRDRAFVAGDY